jgi:uncharacterized lipoprotein YmbA
MTRLSVWLLAALLLAGCSGNSPKPDPHVYLLRAQRGLPDGRQEPPVEIGINRVSVASYLAQQGIVVATTGDQIHAGRQHLWAEPLDSAIRLFLQDAISAALGYPISADAARRPSWDYRVDVRIDEWHGALTGDVRIQASWAVFDGAKQQARAEYRFEQTAAMRSDGYDALVAVQKDLLTALADAIADSLRGLGT